MQMWFKSISVLMVLVVAAGFSAAAQNKTARIDSVKVYRNIESFSLKRKFTKFIYRLVFKPEAASAAKNVKKKVYKKLIQKPYSAFEGKIIRHISIETLDPFGYSIADTVVRSQSLLARTGNKLHVKSHRTTIRNLLLIRQNQAFDSLLVKESERLVRSSGYVSDVSFRAVSPAKNPDSVDIVIRELDKWSIVPGVSASPTSFTVELKDNNFLGLGHESQNGFTWNNAAGDYAYLVQYRIPNFRNTYINATMHAGTDESGNTARSFAIDRPFFSPFAKWAAGASVAHQLRLDNIHVNDSLQLLQRFRFNAQDYWAGTAIRIFKGNTEYSRTTNFIAALRFQRVRYFEKPAESLDPQHFFADENFYLAGIGISTRKYVQDRFIFKYGLTEDVPAGKVYSLTGGYQKKNNAGRLYVGARISSGNYYPWGYLGFNCEYGTFVQARLTEQGVFAAGINYFTGLIEAGKWKFRQFVKPQVMIGIRRFAFDSLTMNDGHGIDGFNSTALSGTSRLVLSLQTQSYSPWNFIGFRFGPFLTFSVAMLGNAATGFRQSKVYSQIGAGVLIKNEHLIINTFQFSFAYYPSIPGTGNNVFKLNSFQTADFGFRDFETGKPAIVLFQ